MHMADALLSPAVGVTMCAVSAGAVAYSAAKVKKDELGEKKLPVMAVAGAFVFASQMINFTIPATGSSGHIGGGVLLAALLGGYPALLTIAAVLVIQCLFFADGGLLALGCNIFNLGVIPCLLVYPLLFRRLTRSGFSGKTLSTASILSAVVGLELGAFCVVLETLASGITVLPFPRSAALMLPIHIAIGLVEASSPPASSILYISCAPKFWTAQAPAAR
jgi:cobalt/nickel transport system permease protein